MIEVICGDVRNLPDIGRFHAILCDPPYELGFMGKSWDASGVAYDADLWRGLLALLHPGGFGMAFGGSRTYHRLACAIEDAGAVLHPMIGWAYGSGFPKATRIDTQVDRDAGAEREVVGIAADFALDGHDRHGPHKSRPTNQVPDGDRWHLPITAPATPLASTWSGHRYGLQALKPAIEPICCFQRPYAGKPWECITKTGAGALWIDGARINSVVLDSERRTCKTGKHTGVVSFGLSDYQEPLYDGQRHNPAGRWPANLVLGHSPSCNGTCADGCAVKALGEQSGVSGHGHWPKSDADIFGTMSGRERRYDGHGAYDNQVGTAARFFTQVDWQLEQAEPLFYQAKASRRERDAGLPDGQHSQHPTVKPIALARHLATLLLPPPEYAPRRLLVPFCGSGSEMIGAMLAGWEEVVGIEQDAEYCELARARIAHWMRQPALAEVAA